MIKNMTLYEKVGQMLLYYIPKEEDPTRMLARWQFGGYILFSRNFENSTPAKTRSDINDYQSRLKFRHLWQLTRRAAELIVFRS